MERLIAKTIPRSRENRGPVSRDSNAPAVATSELKEAAILTGKASTGAQIVREIILQESRYTPAARVFEITPVTIKPLRGVFWVPNGGGRIYGGGTSPEAIRRARRKAKALRY